MSNTRPTEHLLRSLAGHLEQQANDVCPPGAEAITSPAMVVLDCLTSALRLTADQLMHEREDLEAKVAKEPQPGRCPGCDVPPAERVNLPADWSPDSGVPANATVHQELEEPSRSNPLGGPRRFVFIGDELHGRRHYLPARPTR